MSERPIAPSRWLAKKGARAAVAGLGRLRPVPGVRAVTYHRFGEGSRMPFTVTAQDFEREMAFLARERRSISLGEFEAHLAGRASLPDGSVLVTIDDGDPSVREIAFPILREHRVPAVLFALAGRPAGFDVMSAAALRELCEGGVTIGSHSVTHRSIARLGAAEARAELSDSKAWLEDAVGEAVTSFAYPFGTRRDVSRETAALLAEAGYETGFTSLHGAVREPVEAEARRLLPRVKVESGDPAWLFPALCDGAMDSWRLVDEGLSGLQKPQTTAP